MVKTSCFHCRRCRFDPSLGKFCMLWCSRKEGRKEGRRKKERKKERKKNNKLLIMQEKSKVLKMMKEKKKPYQLRFCIQWNYPSKWRKNKVFLREIKQKIHCQKTCPARNIKRSSLGRRKFILLETWIYIKQGEASEKK